MAEAIGSLAVIITATDKATSTINAVRDRIGAVTEPTKQLTAAFGRLGEATGLDRVVNGFGALRTQASSAASYVAAAALPLATGGLVAGAAALATNFSRTGRSLMEGARGLGVSVEDLQAFRNAARLVGVDADQAQAGLESFDAVLTDAAFGRNPAAVAASQMEVLGFSIRDAEGKVRSGADALGDLADRYAKLNHDPNAQMEFARIWGVEALDKFLRRGREGVAELQRQARARGVLTREEVERGAQLGKVWDSLGLTGDRLSLTIGGALAPMLERASIRLDAWTRANQDWLATTIEQRVGEVSSGTGTFIEYVDKAITSTIGWEKATTLLEIAIGVRLLGAITGLRASMLLLGATRLPGWMWRLLGIAGALSFTGAAGGEDREFSEQKNEEYLRNHPAPGSDGRSPLPSLWERALNFPNERLPGGREPLTGLPSRFGREAEHRYGDDPRGIRNNNPLNLSFANQPGATPEPGSGRFARFDTMEAGISASVQQMVRHAQRRGADTIEKLINVWAPASDGNNVAAYLNVVSRAAGISPTQRIDYNDPALVQRIVGAMARHENGREIDPAVIARGVAAGLGRPQAPAAAAAAPAPAAAPRAEGPVPERGEEPMPNPSERAAREPLAVVPSRAPGGRASLDVRFSNAPDGMTVRSRTEGDLDVADLRIEHGMQDWAAA